MNPPDCRCSVKTPGSSEPTPRFLGANPQPPRFLGATPPFKLNLLPAKRAGAPPLFERGGVGSVSCSNAVDRRSAAAMQWTTGQLPQRSGPARPLLPTTKHPPLNPPSKVKLKTLTLNLKASRFALGELRRRGPFVGAGFWLIE